MSERSTRYSIISVITVSLEFYYTFLVFFMSTMLAWRQVGKAYVFRCLLYLFLKSVFLLYFFVLAHGRFEQMEEELVYFEIKDCRRNCFDYFIVGINYLGCWVFCLFTRFDLCYSKNKNSLKQ